MKQIFTFLIILIGFVSQAQTLRVSTNTEDGITTTDSLWFTHNEYVNYVFGNLYMQEVTTNFLQDTTSFCGKSQYIFEHVDKSQISSGLLSEYTIN